MAASDRGGTVVGSLMLEIDPDEEDGRPYWLWRLMIGAANQRQGYGRAALQLALDELRARGAPDVYPSWVPGDGSPGPFYEQIGFRPTGELDDDELDDDELVARLIHE